ncbi:unnamed protein product [Blepharisma stoltei]|uniref:Uncharacterized protein n=1 Tax=Blepharisma stoltei TaxID=1481888 RepID=A0AAU9IH40_9CILI|nr:unnamed protein product [Blepharisma stoltei]
MEKFSVQILKEESEKSQNYQPHMISDDFCGWDGKPMALPNIKLKSPYRRSSLYEKLKLDSLAIAQQNLPHPKTVKQKAKPRVDTVITYSIPTSIKILKAKQTPKHLRNYSQNVNSNRESPISPRITVIKYEDSGADASTSRRFSNTSHRDRNEIRKIPLKIRNFHHVEKEINTPYKIKPSQQVISELRYFMNESTVTSPRSAPRSPISLKSEFLKFANISQTLEEFLAKTKLSNDRSKTPLNKPRNLFN